MKKQLLIGAGIVGLLAAVCLVQARDLGCSCTAQPSGGTQIVSMHAWVSGADNVIWIKPYPMSLPESAMSVMANYWPSNSSGSILVSFTCSNNTQTASVPLSCSVLQTNDDGTLEMMFYVYQDCGSCSLRVVAPGCTIQTVNTNSSSSGNGQ